MLVITDQRARAIRRERRLPRTRKPEENANVAILANIRGTVHRQYVAIRQNVVQIAENRFLDLTGVLRAGNQHHAFLEIHHDGAIGIDAIALRIRLIIRRVQNRQFRNEVGSFLRARLTKHIAREKAVPWAFADHADLQLIGRIGTDHEVLHVDLAPLQIRQHLQTKRVEPLFRIALVDRAPPNVVARRIFFDNEFIVRRTAGVGTRFDDQSAALRNRSASLADRRLVKRLRAQVPMGRRFVIEAVILQAVLTVFLQLSHSLCARIG